MATSTELIKEELIGAICTMADKRLGPERAALAKPFCAELYRHAPPADIAVQRVEHLYAAAVSLLGFIRERSPGRPNIRVFTPGLDEHGWHTQHTVIEIVTDDMPFLVDSVLGELSRQQVDVQLVVHPVIEVVRDEAGVLSSVAPVGSGSSKHSESVIHVRVAARDEEQRVQLVAALARVLEDVAVAVRDFEVMLHASAEVASQLSRLAASSDDAATAECAAFMSWLNDGHFVFFGARYLDLEVPNDGRSVRPKPHAGLGLLRDPSRDVFEHYQPARQGELIRILKANQRSTVHRPVHFDAVLVSDVFNGAPRPASHLFIGLFSLSAYSCQTEAVPLLRHKAARVLERAGLTPGSHDYKALMFILETYPRDELFQIAEDDLLHISLGILQLQNRQRVALFSRRDPFGRFVSCLVFVPRDRMDTALRLRIQEILADSYGGSISAFYTRLGDEPLARVHLIVKTQKDQEPRFDHTSIERKLFEATRSWQDRMKAALINELGEEHGLEQASRYAGAFPAAYRESYDEITAVGDLTYIEAAVDTGEMTMHLYHPVEAGAFQLALKVFLVSGRPTALSDVVPMLENMGLRVIGETPYEIRPLDHAPIRAHNFDLETEGQVAIEVGQIKESFIEVLSCVWRGSVSNDGFNKLVLHAGLRAREVKLLRAYARYLRQAHLPFSLGYMQQTLRKNPEITRLLVQLFMAKFDPDLAGFEGGVLQPSARITRAVVLEEMLLHKLDRVASLDEDRILRAFIGVIGATTRTNFFQRGENGERDYVSFKIDSGRVRELPAPRPYREIFVFSPRVEGVHLRFGPVARGGLRWSDRQEDFRTEVLGLVKAQQVKNAVIVPVGSKGGFVVKQPPSEGGREAVLAEGIACYRTFIQGLLDVTDNRVGDQIVTPDRVVAHDDPDPYLVVAADKGTATFSDIANELSEQHGFWLGDAFASGGSAGYDHKKMAITAKGAWESIKRHFRELGRDIQRDPFTCAGVGDMSGDVFGNALLLSRVTRLVAAFNHLHIFIDPNPDPGRSFEERRRLFRLSRSAWSDYDASVISKGGGVFDRKAKSVTLSTEARTLLGIKEDTPTPNQVISAILCMPVDLLFFGGIGTYVKSTAESQADAGDRSNDAVRVDGRSLQARVVGEGANLAMTQRGRIEFAALGGRCNTDFIDNSAGVDCSDHEVNIKILLGDAEHAEEITRKQRDELLLAMTDEVAELVLRDNYLQAQALSVTQSLGLRMTDRIARAMTALERSGVLRRALEALPDDEVLADRQRRRLGFTRPELCLLLCYSKNALYPALLESPLPDDPYLQSDLSMYFPARLREQFRERIAKHRLRREIIATVACNEIVNRVGITFMHEAVEKSGMAPHAVARAYVVARDVFGMRELWHVIEGLDNRATTDVQALLLLETGRAITAFSLWLLRVHGAHFDIGDATRRYATEVGTLLERLDSCISQSEKMAWEQRARGYVDAGVPEEVARHVAALRLLLPVGDIVATAQELNLPVEHVARIYFTVGDEFGTAWLRQLALDLPTERAWDRHAVGALVDDLYACQRLLAVAVARNPNGDDEPEALIQHWVAGRKSQVDRCLQLFTELRATKSVDLPMLVVANRRLVALAT
jgi:glutamate dehydrogenase